MLAKGMDGMSSQPDHPLPGDFHRARPAVHRESGARLSDVSNAMETLMPTVDGEKQPHIKLPHKKTYDRDVARAQNDALRKTLTGGKFVLAASVMALSADVRARAIEKMREYKKFNETNDPFGDHSFGVFELRGQRFCWQIEAFDKDLRYGSLEPCDPEKTIRVLTLTLACEN